MTDIIGGGTDSTERVAAAHSWTQPCVGGKLWKQYRHQYSWDGQYWRRELTHSLQWPQACVGGEQQQQCRHRNALSPAAKTISRWHLKHADVAIRMCFMERAYCCNFTAQKTWLGTKLILSVSNTLEAFEPIKGTVPPRNDKLKKKLLLMKYQHVADVVVEFFSCATSSKGVWGGWTPLPSLNT